MKKIAALAIVGLSLLSANVMAAVKSEAVNYELDGTKFIGQMYYDDAVTEKRPGVLVVHEWWGLNDHAKNRAEELAKMGYVAFAADMYGDGKVTDKPAQAKEWMTEVTSDVDAWRGTALAGLEQLKKSDKVDTSKLAAIGYCFGGGTILQMAYSGVKDLAGVVSFHGSLPSAPDGTEINTKVLAFHGNADAMVPPATVTKFLEQMEKTGADWQFVAFGSGVRHAFTNPDAGKYGVENLKYDEKADKRSWAGMQTFFNEIFK
ncbi:dienelactone hydrolase family protein [Thiothrix lacustris]|jgi:dienelactone hydrolase|uniref:Dienelactone hydrolase family protein n=1 Tax=Thiothrix lacustris TaxID=525917 RepID=A0ABY9MSR2_9GAMM|nr:dienelactone hydrolase family protein [Thiothrix lacustris]WML91689.1 dienelactone hydrolase family protein [Thiothrix lacustris]